MGQDRDPLPQQPNDPDDHRPAKLLQVGLGERHHRLHRKGLHHDRGRHEQAQQHGQAQADRQQDAQEAGRAFRVGRQEHQEGRL